MVADALFQRSTSGIDLLTGGRGADVFAFNADGSDRITDFSSRQGDRIDLSGVDGDRESRGLDPLSFIGTDDFSGHAGELRYEIVGDVTRLLVNLDADEEAEYILVLDGEHKISFDDLIGLLRGPPIYGTSAAETIDGTATHDLIFADRGNDVLSGGAGDDELFGENGNDLLKGGRGHDLLDGGKGLDTVDLSDARGDLDVTLLYGQTSTVNENGVAGDTLFSVEGIVGGSGDDHLSGGTEMFGGSGDDYLNGSYAKVLNGGDGDDYLAGYYTVRGKSVVNGGQGTDTVEVYSFGGVIDLAAGTSTDAGHTNVFRDVENVLLLLGGGLNATILGNEAANRLRGGGGDDVLDGRGAIGGRDIISGEGGDDRIGFGLGEADLFGGDGNDTFLVRSAGTARVVIDGGEGTDTLSLADGGGAGTIDLAAGTFGVAGGASGTMTSVEAAVGGASADTITGDGGANALEGGGDADTLAGAAGADWFVFRAVADSSGDRIDRITDFTQGDGDLIDLGEFGGGAKSFRFIGTDAFSRPADPYTAELRYEINGDTTVIQGDWDKDGAVDIVIRLDGAVTLTAADFVF